ncbi:MAG: YdcF family protein [Caldimonas sp.]
MNALFAWLGIEAWKPVLTALLLPPVPLLALVLIGARLLWSRRAAGWLVLGAGVVALWLGSTPAVAQFAAETLLHPPAALTARRIDDLRLEAQAKRSLAIVVLGGGVEALAPEYGISSLQYGSLERLRYGVWLGRQTGAPLAFSGGVGHAQPDSMPEAQVAAKIAAQEFGRPLRWIEDQSRDTRENAARTIALLRPAGIGHIVLVTHGWHMPRAMRAFGAAAGSAMRIEAAPMGLATGTETPVLMWLPSAGGFTQMRSVLREWLGRLTGA